MSQYIDMRQYTKEMQQAGSTKEEINTFIRDTIVELLKPYTVPFFHELIAKLDAKEEHPKLPKHIAWTYVYMLVVHELSQTT